MTMSEIEVGMRVQFRSQTDPSGDDEGRVLAIIDRSHVMVGWDSGVRTPCDVAILDPESDV